ncbi:MAG TPA: hypothetical protein VGQ78_07020 [Vicinamibacteria bacterium]|nr:hypothetical protein [Vicinamibacteria bacterium]
MRIPVLLMALCAAPAAAQDFWAHWGDGRAELNGYRLVQPRYGAPRVGTAVLVFVTEDLSDALRVKADPGKHPAAEVYPVMKLNAVRDFQTGIYDYNVMTSVFARVSAGWPVAKVSFSSQEWCGHVYHQLLPRGPRLEGEFHSYFDGEADGRDALEMPADGIFEDALPILLRGWNGVYLARGASRTVRLLPSLLRARLEHKPLAWTNATIARAPRAAPLAVPAGAFEVDEWTVSEAGGRTTRYFVESAPPYRLVRWSSDTGEEAVLLGSTRLAYWKLNGPGGERHLAELGLPVP